MKNIFTVFVFLLISSLASAQLKAELRIQNLQLIDDEVFFDIFINQAATSTGTINLAFSDFVIEYDPAVFVSPTIEKIENPTPPSNIQNGYCSFIPTVLDETKEWLCQSYYYEGTEAEIIGNTAIINLNPPLPYDDIDFEEKIAIIDEQASEHRLGRFKLTGYQSGIVDLNWVTTGPDQFTKIFVFEDQYPYWSNSTIVTENIDPPNLVPVSIRNIEKIEAGMSVFPNPAREKTMLTLPVELNKDAEIIVYNSLGHQISSSNFSAGQLQQQIDLSDLATGYYLVQLKGDDFQVTRKVLKVK